MWWYILILLKGKQIIFILRINIEWHGGGRRLAWWKNVHRFLTTSFILFYNFLGHYLIQIHTWHSLITVNTKVIRTTCFPVRHWLITFKFTKNVTVAFKFYKKFNSIFKSEITEQFVVVIIWNMYSITKHKKTKSSPFYKLFSLTLHIKYLNLSNLQNRFLFNQSWQRDISS